MFDASSDAGGIAQLNFLQFLVNKIVLAKQFRVISCMVINEIASSYGGL